MATANPTAPWCGRVVDECASQSCYIILDLHWSDRNAWGQDIGQHSMPDTNSLAFWQDFAPVFANNPAVLYDLYNEPHDVSWDVWLNGGRITDKPNARGQQVQDYDCVGMQAMLGAVRSTGAKNVIVAGGLDWAYDFSGILDGRQLADPTGNGVIYANHCYDNKNDSVYTWIAKMEKATATLPVIVSEFGGDSAPSKQVPADDWLLHVLEAIQEHQWSYTAWDLHTSAGPTLISDWNYYTPTPNFGYPVFQALSDTLSPYMPPPEPPRQARAPGPGGAAARSRRSVTLRRRELANRPHPGVARGRRLPLILGHMPPSPATPVRILRLIAGAILLSVALLSPPPAPMSPSIFPFSTAATASRPIWPPPGSSRHCTPAFISISTAMPGSRTKSGSA